MDYFIDELVCWLDNKQIEIRAGVWLATADVMAEEYPGERDWSTAEVWMSTNDGVVVPVRCKEDLPEEYRLTKVVEDGGKCELNYVINPFGRIICYEAAEILMDEEICNDLAFDIAPCSEQEFFDAYCVVHQDKFHEEFEPAKANPVW